MSLKEKLKKIPVLYPMAKYLKCGIKDMSAIGGFLAERRLKRGDGPVRVGFLCQYIPSWVKLQPIYDMMRADSRFEPFLICVPSGIQDGVLMDDSGKNDTLDYFFAHGYPEAINALQPDGTWLDLKAMNLSYVFYPRPYNAYMPPCYQSQNVYRHSRICLILYGMAVTQEIIEVTLNRDFYRYVYCYFAELPYPRIQNKRKGWLLHLLGLQHSFYFGIPGVETIRAASELPRPAWDFAGDGSFRVMWTPRWTTDLSLGGSNFFTFYEFLPALAQKDPDYAFLFRPHPLAISHFLETGELTQQQADKFLQICRELPNISLDQEKDYSATFWGTDVLVTDISGIIPEYFATGKPMIFCAANMHLTLEQTTQKMIDVSYVVHTAQELEQCLSNLKQGIDPKAEQRQQILNQYFGEDNSTPNRKILECLAGKKQ